MVAPRLAPPKKASAAPKAQSSDQLGQTLKILHSTPKELGTDWFALSMVVGVHISALVGLYLYPSPSSRVVYTTAFMYFLSGFGITAGYHRMWSHGGYKAHWILSLPLAIGGTCALQGSIIWWSALHRLHHKFGDMPCDPYGPQRGFWYSHVLWIFFPRHYPQLKLIDVSDLRRDPICYWQHRLYKYAAIPLAYGLPLLLAPQDWLETTLWAGALARVAVWHTTWSVNSVAHWLGSDSYNADHTAKDHLLTAFLTLGEGLHSAHHSFPTDWRNGFMWYHYDPTKWLISVAHRLGLATNLHTTPLETIEKARFLVDEVKLERRRQQLNWPSDPSALPEMSVAKYMSEAKKPGATLLALHGFVHNVSPFMKQHPGGSKILKAYCGKSPDVIERAFTGLHPHTSLAFHLAEMIRVARLVGDKE